MRERADKLLVARGLAPSREKAQAMIMAGLVLSGPSAVLKSGSLIDADADLRLKDRLPYVGRGGLKLAEALDRFAVDVRGMIAVDVGSSTGGFTDCLLQRGAKKVYAVDVDTKQLDAKLRVDARVVTIEKNARYLEPGDLPEPPDVVTVDVSFISLLKVLSALKGIPGVRLLLTLVKPQFEAGREQVGKGGVVRDPEIHRSVLTELARWGDREGFGLQKVVVSPIRGPAGNVEFLALIAPGEHSSPDVGEQIDAALAAARTDS